MNKTGRIKYTKYMNYRIDCGVFCHEVHFVFWGKFLNTFLIVLSKSILLKNMAGIVFFAVKATWWSI